MAISLQSLQRGRSLRPPKIVIYGGPKVGKSTFAAGAPKAVFLQTEEGLDALDVVKFPMAQTFTDVMGALQALATEDHDFETVVVDSLDWLEPLIWRHVAKAHDVKNIEQIGYGKGYVEALSHWRELLDALDYLRNERGMAVVCIAHDEIRKMQPVDGEPYDYAALKLHKRAADMVQEWADVIGYACLKTAVRKDDLGFNREHARAVSLQKRILHVGTNPAYVSGNRYGLPAEIPLSWADFQAAMAAAVNPSTNQPKE